MKKFTKVDSPTRIRLQALVEREGGVREATEKLTISASSVRSYMERGSTIKSLQALAQLKGELAALEGSSPVKQTSPTPLADQMILSHLNEITVIYNGVTVSGPKAKVMGLLNSLA